MQDLIATALSLLDYIIESISIWNNGMEQETKWCEIICTRWGTYVLGADDAWSCLFLAFNICQVCSTFFMQHPVDVWATRGWPFIYVNTPKLSSIWAWHLKCNAMVPFIVETRERGCYFSKHGKQHYWSEICIWLDALSLTLLSSAEPRTASFMGSSLLPRVQFACSKALSIEIGHK